MIPLGPDPIPQDWPLLPFVTEIEGERGLDTTALRDRAARLIWRVEEELDWNEVPVGELSDQPSVPVRPGERMLVQWRASGVVEWIEVYEGSPGNPENAPSWNEVNWDPCSFLGDALDLALREGWYAHLLMDVSSCARAFRRSGFTWTEVSRSDLAPLDLGPVSARSRENEAALILTLASLLAAGGSR